MPERKRKEPDEGSDVDVKEEHEPEIVDDEEIERVEASPELSKLFIFLFNDLSRRNTSRNCVREGAHSNKAKRGRRSRSSLPQTS